MKVSRLFPLLVSLLLTGAAMAQTYPAPEVHSISPNTGPSAGGTLVVLSGDYLDLPPNFACVAPCPARVSFGGKEVAATAHTNKQVVVVAPANDPGTVAVVVTTGDGRKSTTPVTFTYQGPTEAQYERVLIPVYLDGALPGNAGSLWRTDLWIYNNGPKAVNLAPWPCPADGVCPAVFPNTKGLPPLQAQHNLEPFFRVPTANISRVLYVTRAEERNVAFQLRIADTSRNTLDAGTEVPVVREKELRAGKVTLQNVPLDPNYRVLIRIYDLGNTEATFRIRAFVQGEGASQEPYQIAEVRATTNETGEFRTQAAYAQWGELQVPFISTTGPLAARIEIEAVNGNSQFWAFAAVTNNLTQHVTTVTPQ